MTFRKENFSLYNLMCDSHKAEETPFRKLDKIIEHAPNTP